jgi:anti-sigma-K factor RskA
MSDLTEDFDGEDLSAGEYALGVLDGHERNAAAERVEREPAFAREVQAWEERLYPMASAIRETTPPAHVWPRIQRALGPHETRVVDLGQRRAVKFWRAWALAATAAAAVAVLFLAVRPQAIAPVTLPVPAAQPLLIAELVDKDGHGFITASYDPNKGELRTVPSLGVPIGVNRAAELWVIAGDGNPRSLGVIDASHPTVLRVSDALRPSAKATSVLAITSEQPGGSPSGKPTTAPKWSGKLITI